MRTTLELDDDLLQVARQLAAQRGMTLGRVISELLRKALAPKVAPRVRNGVQLFVPTAGAKPAHLALVDKLRDETRSRRGSTQRVRRTVRSGPPQP